MAAFIGSPAINLLEASVEGSRISIGGTTIDVEADGAVLPSRLAVGVRPEDIRIDANEGLPARVLYVEDLGAEIVAHLESDAVPVSTDEQLDAVAVAQRRRARIVVRLSGACGIAEGQNVRLTFDPEKLHLFDLQTGRAIARREAPSLNVHGAAAH